MDNTPIKMLSLVLSFLGTISWTFWMIRRPCHFGYGIAPMTWMLHIFIYYLCNLYLFPPVPDHPIYAVWSSILRLHGVIMGSVAAIVLLHGPRNE